MRPSHAYRRRRAQHFAAIFLYGIILITGLALTGRLLVIPGL